jgi:hypothetical protein
MKGSSVFKAWKAALAAAMLALPAAAQQAPAPAGPLAIERQGSFFVGGREVQSDALSTLPAYAPSGTITVDQMYVRYQVPVGATGRPLVLIHGCCLTGKTWETTPDGRMGWDEYFVRRGHPTYVIDQAWRGRSAASPTGTNRVRMGRRRRTSCPPSSPQGMSRPGRSSASARRIRRSSPAYSSRSRRRRSSGSRWCRTS